MIMTGLIILAIFSMVPNVFGKSLACCQPNLNPLFLEVEYDQLEGEFSKYYDPVYSELPKKQETFEKKY